MKVILQIMRTSFLALALSASALLAQNPAHFANIKQLTFGGSNAEAYWSPDGTKLVFQSTREPYYCDQIFIMNSDGSNQKMISTGRGRTTCGYFMPDGKQVLWASTHEWAPQCPAPPDRSKGYLWPVYPGYDIYLSDLDGNIKKKLTDERGYDAEATVNFKTGKIIYTSMHTGDLELWEMRLDGSRKKQLTRELGYDGGAVYSRDGKKLVWRSGHPKTPETIAKYKELLADDLTSPMKMEIFVADADGRNAKQITNFNCASFAPTFTPDGSKILFSSNKHNCDGRKFELFMVNLDGSGLEQVTAFGSFTGFPEFSPDGKKLAFVTDWQAKQRFEFNVFTADWK
jgi:TolB protein